MDIYRHQGCINNALLPSASELTITPAHLNACFCHHFNEKRIIVLGNRAGVMSCIRPKHVSKRIQVAALRCYIAGGDAGWFAKLGVHSKNYKANSSQLNNVSDEKELQASDITRP